MEHPIVPVHILEELHKKEILGAGKRAIVYADGPEQVIKKFYTNTDAHIKEAAIQRKVQKILQDFPVRVPDIYAVHPTKSIIYMERIHPPANFAPHQIHLILGHHNMDELDCLWHIHGIRLARGFFASPETISSLAKVNNWPEAKIENLAHIMGSIISHLLDNYIIPTGIKWSLDHTGRIWLFNFTMCHEGYIDPLNYFYMGDSSNHLDLYTPNCNMPGYKAYYDGYFGHSINLPKEIDNMYFDISSLINEEEDVEEVLKKEPIITFAEMTSVLEGL